MARAAEVEAVVEVPEGPVVAEAPEARAARPDPETVVDPQAPLVLPALPAPAEREAEVHLRPQDTTPR